MSEAEHPPGHPLEQAEVVELYPGEDAGTGICRGCGEREVVHVCHGDVWMCSGCCEDAKAGKGKCQRFIGREREGTLLVNRKRSPAHWGDPEQWLMERAVVDIGRGRGGPGQPDMTNTEPGDPGWLGNPYRVGDEYTREESVSEYRDLFYRMTAQNPEFREAIRDIQGAVLVGWCAPELCHGDVILEWLDLHG